MISHELKSVFIDIPNTTGNVIEKALANSAGEFQPLQPEDLAQNTIPEHAIGYGGLNPWQIKHIPARFLKADYDDYYKFCFVRNPWDLMTSSYLWWTQQAKSKYKKLQGQILEKIGFDNFVSSLYTDYLNEIFHCGLGQSYWLIDGDGKPCVDFIGRFENMHDDFKRVLNRIGLSPIPLHLSKDVRNKALRKLYNLQTQKIISRKFKKDIETFDYQFTETVPPLIKSKKSHYQNTSQMIWLASWPRSGNTFLRTILWHCFGCKSSSVYPKDLNSNKPLEEYVGHVELDSLDLQQTSLNKNLAMIKTHESPPDQNPAIYVVRDGRPACVSLWRFYNQIIPLSKIVSGQHRFGPWSRHIQQWDPLNRPNTLLLKYEEMLTDLEGIIDKIASFINRQPIKKEIPPRENIAKVGGQHVNIKSDWTEIFKREDLDRFWLINGNMMKKIYGKIDDLESSL